MSVKSSVKKVNCSVKKVKVNVMVKSKLPPGSGSSLEAVEPHP